MNIPFLKIRVDSNYDLGFQIGNLLQDKIKKTLYRRIGGLTQKALKDYTKESHNYFILTAKYFPQYIEEIKGMAEGANVSSEELFLLNCREITDRIDAMRCTTIVGRDNANQIILGHNEDWEAGAEYELYVIRAEMKNSIILGLNYAGEILGNSVCMNSLGVTQAINDLTHKGNSRGVPRNFIARAILDTSSYDEIENIFKTYPRASGFNHVLVVQDKIIDIESIDVHYDSAEIEDRIFIHTNHYLSQLKKFEATQSQTTFQRYQHASTVVRNPLTEKQMKEVLENKENYPMSILNDETIASVIIRPNWGFIEVAIGNKKNRTYKKYTSKN